MKSDRETVIRIVRKVNKHGGHHGGAWKVAFADFMTAGPDDEVCDIAFPVG